MAQGQYYTRQQLNQLNQNEINARAAQAAAKKADEERNAPYNARLSELQGKRAELERYYDNLIADAMKSEIGRKSVDRLIEKKADVLKKVGGDIRTTERAQSKGITVLQQEKSESSSRSRRRNILAASAQKNEIIQDLSSKYGYAQAKRIYDAMSPEARGTYYEQATDPNFQPTPNRAAQKDAYNRAQERWVEANKDIARINADAQATYDEINEGWLDSKAGEYFRFKRTGLDSRGAPSPNELIFGAVTDSRQVEFSRRNYEAGKTDTFLYNYVVTPYRETNRFISEGFKRSGVGGTEAELRNPEPNPFIQAVLGERLDEKFRTARWRGNFATFVQRQTLDRPIGFAGDIVIAAGLGKVFSITAGGGYQVGSFGSNTFLGKVGGLTGATLASAPVLYGTGQAYGFVSSLPVRQDVSRAGIPYEVFTTAVTEGYQNTGVAGELFTGFGNKENFAAAYSRSVREQGYDPAGSVGLALDARDATIRQEGLYLFGAGAVANVVGARTSAATLSRFGASASFTDNFARGFVDIGLAGISEGSLSSIGQNLARGEDVQYGRAAFSGALGFASAGALGGTIQGATFGGFPKTRRTFSALGYALDPTEFGSDFITGLGGSPYGSFFRGSGAGNPIVAAYPFLPVTRTNQEFARAPFSQSSAFSAPAPQPRRERGVFSEPLPFVNPNPKTDPFPLVNPRPRSNPNPFVDVPVNPNTNPNPVVDVPVTPAPFVPTNPNPNPVVDVPVNPMVDVPVSKFPLWGLGAGQKLRGRQRRGFGLGFSKARYAPSFAALELGIGASKINTNRTFSGLEIRPFLAPQRKKKKKGKRTRAKRSRRSASPFSVSIGGSPI